jgi:hypothetical protein
LHAVDFVQKWESFAALVMGQFVARQLRPSPPLDISPVIAAAAKRR